MCMVSDLRCAFLECLYLRLDIVSSARKATYIGQDIDHLLFLEQLQDALAQVVEMRGKRSEIDTPGVSLQGVHHPL